LPPGYDGASASPDFANGAVTGAFAYAAGASYGSGNDNGASAANDNDTGATNDNGASHMMVAGDNAAPAPRPAPDGGVQAFPTDTQFFAIWGTSLATAVAPGLAGALKTGLQIFDFLSSMIGGSSLNPPPPRPTYEQVLPPDEGLQVPDEANQTQKEFSGKPKLQQNH
jgi:hypothetical protein